MHAPLCLNFHAQLTFFIFFKKKKDAYGTFHNTLCEISTSSLPLLTSGAGLSCVYEFGLWSHFF